MLGTVTSETPSREEAAPRPWFRTRACPAALAGACAALLLVGLLPLDRWPSWCLTRQLTGVPCPTCGMARSVHALLHGNVADSIRYHPLAPVTAVIGSVLVLCHGVMKVFKGRGLPLWVWLAAAAIAAGLLMAVWVGRLASGSIP